MSAIYWKITGINPAPKHATYQRALLFHKILGRNQGRSDLTLSGGRNVGGPFHKAIVR